MDAKAARDKHFAIPPKDKGAVPIGAAVRSEEETTMIAMPRLWSRVRLSTLVVMAALCWNARAEAQMAFYPLAPCRLWDTRSTHPPKMSANATRDFQVRDLATLPLCGVPATAQAVAINVTIVAPTDLGNLRVYPAGTALPVASLLNWAANDNPVANGTIVGLGNVSGKHLSVRVDMPPGSTGQVHTLADVTGYFQ
jgi:hypothetical protein